MDHTREFEPSLWSVARGSTLNFDSPIDEMASVPLSAVMNKLPDVPDADPRSAIAGRWEHHALLRYR